LPEYLLNILEKTEQYKAKSFGVASLHSMISAGKEQEL
jgi:hypothetical protein